MKILVNKLYNDDEMSEISKDKLLYALDYLKMFM